ncbi:hypothetical protein GQ457_05G025390 [Hibiscus cannabinus]
MPPPLLAPFAAVARRCSGDCTGESRAPFGIPRLPLLLSRFGFPRAASKGHENSPKPPPLAAARRRCSGESFGRSRPLIESPRLPLPLSWLGFAVDGPEQLQNPLWPSSFLGSDLLALPSDQRWSEICCSPSFDDPLHHWDSPGNASVAVDTMADDGNEWLWLADMGCGCKGAREWCWRRVRVKLCGLVQLGRWGRIGLLSSMGAVSFDLGAVERMKVGDGFRDKDWFGEWNGWGAWYMVFGAVNGVLVAGNLLGDDKHEQKGQLWSLGSYWAYRVTGHV